MDVLKRWLTPTDKLKPHGWRFACRDRNEATKTQGIICLLDKEVLNFLGYMARKRETDCGSTLNPDCCGVVDIVQCELPICRKFIILIDLRYFTANGVSQQTKKVSQQFGKVSQRLFAVK